MIDFNDIFGEQYHYESLVNNVMAGYAIIVSTHIHHKAEIVIFLTTWIK